MRKLSLLLVPFLLLALSSVALAQDEEEFEEKDLLEVSVFGGGTLPVGGIKDWTTIGAEGPIKMGAKAGVNMGLDIGYFLTPDWTFGIDFVYSRLGIDSPDSTVDSRNHHLFNTSLYLRRYFFSESDLVPFVKGTIGVDVNKFTTSVLDRNIGNGPEYWEYRTQSYDPALGIGFSAGLFYYTFDYGGLFLEANVHHSFTKNINADYEGHSYDFNEATTTGQVHAGLIVSFGSD